eukprot:3422281-Lingulodinium_polyedra.AAC.1
MEPGAKARAARLRPRSVRGAGRAEALPPVLPAARVLLSKLSSPSQASASREPLAAPGAASNCAACRASLMHAALCSCEPGPAALAASSTCRLKSRPRRKSSSCPCPCPSPRR